jgi:ferric-dicitrate binding protein FerR (iron transport regulator)
VRNDEDVGKAYEEARKWFGILETTENIESIWPAFDAWFEASEAHREAYEAVRRRYRQLTGLPPEPLRELFLCQLRLRRAVYPTFCFCRQEWQLIVMTLVVIVGAAFAR